MDTEKLISADDSVRLLRQVMEELDYRKLYVAYAPIGRNPVVRPKNLLKILIYSYMNGIYSSRKIERACRRDINFMYLLDGDPVPDHNTIARFRSGRLADAIEDLFTQFMLLLYEFQEIEFQNLFIDGTKIEANANRYTFVWKKTTEKNEAMLQEKARSLVQRIFGPELPEKLTAEVLGGYLDLLLREKNRRGLEFVSGSGRRKTQLQRDCEAMEDCMARQRRYETYAALFDGRNSLSKTDTDATFMRLKEDHMRNGQLKPAYNVQIGVEAEYIVGVDIQSSRNDNATLIPFLESVQKHYGRSFQNIVADAGYESEENLAWLKQKNMTAYIKPQNYEVSRTRRFKKEIGKRENMAYDAHEDCFTCHNGRKLNYVFTQHRKQASGYINEVPVYECENCDGCDWKSRCTKAQGNKRIGYSKRFDALRKESLANISSDLGIVLRMNRSIQVEGAFGVTKQDYGFRRFLLRGKKQVRIEYLLLAFGFDFNKLHNKIQNQRCRTMLHPISSL